MATTTDWALAAELSHLGADYESLPGLPSPSATAVGRASTRASSRGGRRARACFTEVCEKRARAEGKAVCHASVQAALEELRGFQGYVGRLGRGRVVEGVGGGCEGMEVVIGNAGVRMGVHQLFGRVAGGIGEVGETGAFCARWAAEEDVIEAEFGRCLAVVEGLRRDLRVVGEGRRVVKDVLEKVRAEVGEEPVEEPVEGGRERDGDRGVAEDKRGGDRLVERGSDDGTGGIGNPGSPDDAARRRRRELDLLLSP